MLLVIFNKEVWHQLLVKREGPFYLGKQLIFVSDYDQSPIETLQTALEETIGQPMSTIYPFTPSTPSTHTPIMIEEVDDTTQNIRIDPILQTLKTSPTILPSITMSSQTLQTTKTTHIKASFLFNIGRISPLDKTPKPPPLNLEGGGGGESGGGGGGGSSEGRGGRSRGGKGSGGRGGGKGGGGLASAVAAAAAPNPSDIKAMGQLPPVSDGD